MRSQRGRTKKLIVAFHFQSSDQAGWKCDACRETDLELRRRCGWSEKASGTPERLVWARGSVSTTVCPKSWITAESLALLEQYCAWKLMGHTDFRTLSGRQVDAFCALENELRKGE